MNSWGKEVMFGSCVGDSGQFFGVPPPSRYYQCGPCPPWGLASIVAPADTVARAAGFVHLRVSRWRGRAIRYKAICYFSARGCLSRLFAAVPHAVIPSNGLQGDRNYLEHEFANPKGRPLMSRQLIIVFY